MNTPRDLRRRLEDIADDLATQYGQIPYCEMLHQELGFGQTPMPEEQIALIRNQNQWTTIPDDSIKITVEHEELHLALQRVLMDATTRGGDAAQVVALMLAGGRRIGLAEASGLLDRIADDYNDDKMFGGTE
jgi:hypothetical protein